MRGKNGANADAFASILTMQWRKNTHPKRVRILTQLLKLLYNNIIKLIICQKLLNIFARYVILKKKTYKGCDFTMKVLSIGNSYSANGTKYVHQLAKSCGLDVFTANLYIGGCPLSTHYRNMLSGEKAYWMQINGAMTNFKISMEDALLSDDWDVITLQQQSFRSTDYETFQPYLNELYDFVTTLCPKAKQPMLYMRAAMCRLICRCMDGSSKKH